MNRRWGRTPGPGRLVAGLVLASVTIMVVDARAGSALDPVRDAVGAVVGPAEAAAGLVVRPFETVGDAVRTRGSLRDEVTRLSAENARLKGELAAAPLDRRRLEELDALTRTVRDTGYSVVAARVVAMGPAQSFTRTVTIDAGTSSGVRADMTVLNADGLVGRVVRVTATTATVLLIADSGSVVGGRLGTNAEIGLVRGRGDIGDDGRLELDLVDNAVMPSPGDAVVTWGSENGVPYVAGIPIGRVESVTSSPRQSSRLAVIAPFADFSSLDVVGVVVPRGTQGDRTVLSAGVDSRKGHR